MKDKTFLKQPLQIIQGPDKSLLQSILRGNGMHRWEKLSPCSIDGLSNMKKNLAEHIENPYLC